jgi:hypothetical protein
MSARPSRLRVRAIDTSVAITGNAADVLRAATGDHPRPVRIV